MVRFLMLPPIIRPIPGLSPADEAAFDAYAAELIAQLSLIACLVLLTCTVAWWPLDGWLMPPRHQAAFEHLRLGVIGVELAGIAMFFRWSAARRRALVLAPLIHVAFALVLGLSLGPLGAEGLPWLADALLVIVPSVVLPLRLGRRIFATAAVAAALLGGFFLPDPSTLAGAAAWGQVSFALFAAVFSITTGEVLLRILRRVFFQRQELDRANAALASLTDSLAARVAEKTRELTALARHLDRALEAERRRIARDLHDDLGQLLTAIRYTLARLDARLPDRPEDVALLLDDLTGLVDGTRASVRGFLTDLRPRVLDDYGLAAAAEWLCERVQAAGDLRCTLAVDPAFPGAADVLEADTPLELQGLEPDADTSLALFRVLQEASTNALKHAGATTLAFALRVEGGDLVVEARDDGQGFDADAETAGFGLLGLRERLHAGGGDLQVESRPGGGTTLTARLPARPEAP
ncbi:MAG: sensor histidine kinase [Myxococcales bacterium]|nr:sensor histidine kinase [Myxococcales bacterium]